MQNYFRIIYLYIVSLITLCMIIGGLVFAVNSIALYFYPTDYVFFQDSKDKYIDEFISDTKRNVIKKENYKNEKLKDTIVSIAILTVGGVMHKYHWNLIEKERCK